MAGEPQSPRSNAHEKLVQGQDEAKPNRVLVEFEAPAPPTLVATGPNVMTLQWKQVVAKISAPGIDVESWTFIYELYMRLETGEPSTAAENKWSCTFLGSQLLEQVRGLRPGKLYSFHLRCAKAKPPAGVECDVATIPCSPVVSFSTPATVPSEPRQLDLIAKTPHSLVVKWRPPDECGGPEVEAYTLAMSPHPGFLSHQAMTFSLNGQEFCEVYSGLEPKFTVLQLSPGHSYSFVVKAANAVGESSWSQPGTFNTRLRVPSRPGAPICQAVDTSTVAISWDIPDGNGAPVTLYHCYLDDGGCGEFQLIYTGPDPSCRLTGLKEGAVHRSYIVAANAVGMSLRGEMGHLKLLSLRPGPPARLLVSNITRTGFYLGWSPPRNNGGSPISQFTVDLRPETKAAVREGIPDEWCRIHSSRGPNPVTFSSFDGLAAGCQYQLRVRAHNEAGPGPYSDVLHFQTASDVPFPPSAPRTAASSSRTILLHWDPPGHDGGSKILSYHIEKATGISKDEEACSSEGPFFEAAQTVDGDVTRANISGLKPAHTYLFRVQAANGEGRSAYSIIGTCKTRAAAPDRPPIPRLMTKATRSSFSFYWDAPPANGAPVKSHTLQLWRASTLTAAATKPPRGTNTPPSEASEDVEETMCNMEAAAVSTTSEEAHSETGQKTRRTAGSSQSSTHQTQDCKTSQCKVSGLEPDTEYVVKVRCSNAAGASEWSQPALFRSGRAPPTAPQLLTAEGSSQTEIHLRWQPPLRENGAPVSCYAAEMCCGGERKGAQWRPVLSGSELECRVTNLKCGQAYAFRVRAGNEEGNGPWSVVVATTTLPGPPEALEAPKFSGTGSNCVRVKWQQPNCTGADRLCYRVAASSPGERSRIVYEGSDLESRIDGLTAASDYAFQVQAFNSAGSGPWSEAAHLHTKLLPPPAPLCPSLHQVGRTSLEVGWVLPDGSPSRAAAVSHELEAVSVGDGSTLRQTVRVDVDKYTFTKLKTGVKYQVRMRSAGAGGCGHSAWSPAAEARLPTGSLASLLAESARPNPSSISPDGGDAELKRTKQLQDLAVGWTSATKPARGGPPARQPGVQTAKARARPSKQTFYSPAQRCYRRHATCFNCVSFAVLIALTLYQVLRFA